MPPILTMINALVLFGSFKKLVKMQLPSGAFVRRRAAAFLFYSGDTMLLP
jgi:hypothetical protein